MSSRNIGLSIGHTATKANNEMSGGAGYGGSSALVGMHAVGKDGGGFEGGGFGGGGDGGPTRLPLTERDLPPADTKRWVMRRKAEVVAGVRCGLISLDEACRRYTLSVEEFLSWQRLIDSHGVRGLRATRLQDYRAGGDEGEGQG